MDNLDFKLRQLSAFLSEGDYQIVDAAAELIATQAAKIAEYEKPIEKKTVLPANDFKWRIHVARLFKEIMTNEGTSILHKPLQILLGELLRIAQRAAMLNDDELNLMISDLALYESGDPDHPNYDPSIREELVRRIKEKKDVQTT